MASLKRLLCTLPDEEGSPVGLAAAWSALSTSDEAPKASRALEVFGHAVAAAQAWAEAEAVAGHDDVGVVLALASAFDDMARDLRTDGAPDLDILQRRT